MIIHDDTITCYIPVGGDLELTWRAVESFDENVREVKHKYPQKFRVVLINNTDDKISIPIITHYCDIDIVDSLVPLLHGQSINYIIKQSKNNDFAMSLHNDAQLLSGALEELLDYYTKLEDEKWGCIMLGYQNGDAFVLWNPKFNYTENVWHNPILFPMYYMDNHYYRIMELRDWHIYKTKHDLVNHFGSHYIKNNPVHRRVNEITFPYHGLIYREIWGGYPAAEINDDPLANGTTPVPDYMRKKEE